MKVIYNDGAVLTCHNLKPVDNSYMIADDYRYIYLGDVIEIVEDDECCEYVRVYEDVKEGY